MSRELITPEGCPGCIVPEIPCRSLAGGLLLAQRIELRGFVLVYWY